MTVRHDQIELRDGRRLGYAEYGDPAGTPLFFFQGTPSSRLMHPDESITAEFGVRLIVLDRPGFGLSDFQPGRSLLDWPADIVDVAGQLGLDRFAIVGVSGGVPYVAACAHEIAQRLTAAAVVGGIAPLDYPGVAESLPPDRRLGARLGWYAPWTLRPLLWLLQNPRRDPEGFCERYTAHNLAPDRVLLDQPEFREMLMANYREATRQGVRGFAWEVRLVSRPWGFRLEDISIPIHLWQGELDSSTPLVMAEYMARALPECEVRIVPGEGHFMFFTRWREILAALLSNPVL